jgi:hypothetical protein
LFLAPSNPAIATSGPLLPAPIHPLFCCYHVSGTFRSILDSILFALSNFFTVGTPLFIRVHLIHNK